ncbi:MAG: hypothetical protein HY812_02095 [Planctomycetes bacterium]|nr:hypothetical protein [Planctomycetota bacterium]
MIPGLMPAFALFAALQVAPAEPQGVEDAFLLVPRELVRAGDERPLEQLRGESLSAAVDLEARAVEREAELVALAGGDPGQSARVFMERRLIGLLAAAAGIDWSRTLLPKRSLPLFDRYLQMFAAEHLSFGGWDAARLEAWSAANTDFLATSDPAARARALQARAAVFESLASSALLFQVNAALAAGPLSDDERKRLVSLLCVGFPDAPLSVMRMLSTPQAAAPEAQAAARSGLPPPDKNLPRLDGVEHPVGVVADVGELYTLVVKSRGQ